MPFLFKKIEMRFNLGMVTEHGLVEFNPESWGGRQGKITINDLWHTWRGLFNPRIGEIVKMFLNHKIRCTSRHMQCRRCADRAAHIMRCDQYVIYVCPGGQLTGASQATKVGNIRLNNVNSI
jgi:hypothetical protein